MNTKRIKQLIRQKIAWPGGYQIFLVTRDGETLCCDCARKKYRSIVWDHLHRTDTGWMIDGYFLDCHTDEEIRCDHCGEVFKEAFQEEESE